MNKYFVQLYGNIDDLSNTRILDELDYYMYDVRDKKEMIYYFIKEQSIYIVLSEDTIWTKDRLHTLCRTALRENSFIIIPLTSWNGYINVWKNLDETSVEFFKDPTTFRVNAGRGNKLQKLMCRIKRTLTPKV